MAIRRSRSESAPQTQVVDSEPEVEAVPEPEVAPEPQRRPWQVGQNAGLISKFFEDLNLNEEEQARLQEGFELMRRQFEQMSDEERWAEIAQMAEMGQRWQNMSDQEREGVTQRMREHYEVWRHSDSIELPQFTLD